MRISFGKWLRAFLNKFHILSDLLVATATATAAATVASTATAKVTTAATAAVYNDQYLNRSYLNQIQQHPNPPQEVLNQRELLRLQQDYEDLNRDYAMRQSYRILTPEQELSHTGQMSDFSKDVFHRIQSYQLEQERKRLDPLVQQIEREEIVKTLSLPVGLVGALWYGKSFEFNLSEETKASASTTLPSQTAQVRVWSPTWEGSVEVAAMAGGRDPASERLRLKAGRSIPSEGISGEIVYLGSSNVLWASVSKQILTHCNSELSIFLPLDPVSSDVQVSGERLLLSCGFGF